MTRITQIRSEPDAPARGIRLSSVFICVIRVIRGSMHSPGVRTMSDIPGKGPVDLLRVQINGQEWLYSIAADVFEEPGSWGYLLADVARQVAESLAEDGKGD